MKIEKIIKQKNGKYEIVLEDMKLVTYDEVILKRNILYKKELSDSELKEILDDNNYYSFYSDSIKKLTKKMMCENEYREFLNKHNLSNKIKDSLVNDMKKMNLLNDELYVKAYVYDKFNLSSDGPEKIRNDLVKKKITSKLVLDELSKLSEEDINSKIAKIVSKKLKTSSGSKYMIMNKVINDMQRLGYDKKDVMSYLGEIDDSKSLEKDYDKYYRIISKKENEEIKIEYKLKQKLYQKGYSMDKIEEMINKKRNS